MRDAKYDILFEPLAIGPHVAKNRLYQVPHCNGGGYRDPSAAAAMRGIKSEGGWGVIFTEQTEMHHTSEITPFDSDEEALRMANNSEYGLAASVWTKDLSRALSVSDRLHAGTVSVNTVDALSAMTPFGGMKQSGFGRDLSLHSFDKYCALKTVWVKY